jgi:hypothetical protein
LVFLSILIAQYFHLVIASFSGGQIAPLLTVLLFFLSCLTPPFAHVIAISWQEKLQQRLLSGPGALKSEHMAERAFILISE